ncbi:MAG: siderophore ABC transporter substrate-binding protein [Bilifractor sp.]
MKHRGLIAAGVMACMLLAGCGSAGAAASGAGASSESTGSTSAEAAVTSTASASTEQVTAASSSETPDTVLVNTYNGAGEKIQTEMPYDPQRIAVLDMASLDILDNLGVGDRVVGMAQTSLDYLSSYSENPDIKNLGTIKEADIEAVMETEPDVIFIGGRLNASYDQLNEIAPVFNMETDESVGLVESVRENATEIAKMFGLQSVVDEKMAQFDSRIEKLNAVANGKTAVLGLVTGGNFNILGNDSRGSLIVNEIGFNNIGADNATTSSHGSRGQGGSSASASSANQSSTGGAENNPHGQEASFELISQLNPEYIFAIDRDAAIGADGAQQAAQILDNDLVNGTQAAADGHVIVLAHPAVWYTAEGGITALDVMLQDLENTIL